VPTIIRYDWPVGTIENMATLPEQIQSEINGAAMITSHGFQELLGHDDTRAIIWSAGGNWNNEDPKAPKFHIKSYGSHNFQWDGEILKTISRQITETNK
jgi:hypothetical protein